MYENLIVRVGNETSQAINHAMPEILATNYQAAKRYYSQEELQVAEKQHSAASITFSYSELISLTPDEFLSVQKELQRSVLSHYSQAEKAVPPQIAAYIIPGVPSNVLIHEIEHLNPLPKNINKDAKITIIFLKDSMANEFINGFTEFNTDAMSNSNWAISFSEPSSLSSEDIMMARHFAIQTGDRSFINEIEKKISTRSTH